MSLQTEAKWSSSLDIPWKLLIILFTVFLRSTESACEGSISVLSLEVVSDAGESIF